MTGTFTRRRLLAIAAAATTLPGRHALAQPGERIVVAGGALAEIVVALGAGDLLAGVDTTSQYPARLLRDLPNVGYMRALAAEGILALRPSLLLASDQAGPPAAISQLEAAGLRIARIRDTMAVADVSDKVRAVAAGIGRVAAGEALAGAIAADIGAVAAALPSDLRLPGSRPPGVLFLFSASGGRLMAAGQRTAADAMIAFAGGRNVMAGYDSYKQFAPEAALAADPDVIVVADQAAVGQGGLAALIAQPQLRALRAVRDGRVTTMDTLYLLGLGPRTAHAGRDLAAILHPGHRLPALPARPWVGA